MNEVKTVVLKKDFYEKHKEHREILSDKDGRPYLTLVIECKDKMFAIPFRTIQLSVSSRNTSRHLNTALKMVISA